MKVAFCNRPQWDTPLGGDGVQMLKTKEALERRYDIAIDIITNPNDLNQGYDIIHVFNLLTYEISASFVKKGKSLGVPVVISSIFWDYTYIYDWLTNLFIYNKLSAFSAKMIRAVTHLSARVLCRPVFLSRVFRRELINCCEISSAVLPNSIEESNLLQHFLRIDLGKKVTVVFNGTDVSTDREQIISSEEFHMKYKIPRNYVLQVGRIEPLKNQINLLYALRHNREIPIVFLGKISNALYYKKVKRMAEKRGNVFFIDAVPHDQVAAFYKYASVHVLLSLRESPGLVSLEAQVWGCPIVVAEAAYAPVETYFRSDAYVVNPFDFNEISQAILQAYDAPRKVSSEMNFTWDVAAKQTFGVYKDILSSKI